MNSKETLKMRSGNLRVFEKPWSTTCLVICFVRFSFTVTALDLFLFILRLRPLCIVSIINLLVYFIVYIPLYSTIALK
jgi:hypothetical protein